MSVMKTKNMPSINFTRSANPRSQGHHIKDQVDPQERMRKSELITCMTSYGIFESSTGPSSNDH
jgi:hypothetical protein